MKHMVNSNNPQTVATQMAKQNALLGNRGILVSEMFLEAACRWPVYNVLGVLFELGKRLVWSL